MPSGWAWWHGASSVAAWPAGQNPGLSVLGIGYATPYSAFIARMRSDAWRSSGGAGGRKMALAAPTLATLVDDELPLSDAAVDRVLLVHALEMSQDSAACCAKPGGCSPPVAGWWRWCRTGAACGRASIRPRSDRAVPIRARKSPSFCATAGLHRSDGARRCTFGRSAGDGSCAPRRLGACGRGISAPFAGVHIVEATKQVYRVIPARRQKRRLMPALKPVLAPSPGT